MSGSDHVVEIINGIAINDGELTAIITPKLLTVKTKQGFLTINSNTINRINWAVNLGEEIVIRVIAEGIDFDLDYLDKDNQSFLYSLLGSRWKRYLHPSHKAKYDKWVADQSDDD